MSLRKRLPAVTVVATLIAIAAPAATAGAAAPAPAPQLPSLQLPSMANICLPGILDLGPFGPLGPYGKLGPYGPHGPLAKSPNPIGNAAECGGLITYILRGGNLSSFVQSNIPPGK